MGIARRLVLFVAVVGLGVSSFAVFDTDPTNLTLDSLPNRTLGETPSLSSQADQLGSLLETKADETTQRGLALLKENRIDEAKALLAESLGNEPKQVDAWLALLYTEMRQGQLIPAQKVATKALQHFPRHPEVRTHVALLAAVSGHPAKAIAFLEDTLAADPDAIMPALHLANMYVQARHPEYAVPLFEHLLTKHPRDAGLYSSLAHLHTKTGDLPSAESTLRKALVQCQETTELKLLLGRVILRLNRPGEAASWLEQIPEGYPQERLAVHFLSEAYTADQDIQAAIRLLQSWLSRHPKDALLRYRLALLHQASGDPAEAIRELRTTLQHAPSFVPALNDLASLLCEAPVTLSEAATFSSQALEQSPKNPAVLDTAGWVAWLQNDHTTALKHLEAARAQLPDHPHIQLHLAVVLATAPGASEAQKTRAQSLAKQAIKKQPAWSKHPRLIKAGLATP